MVYKLLHTNQQNFILCNGMRPMHGPMRLGNAIMSFQREHPFLNLALHEQAKNFKPNEWGNLGPLRLTACAEEYCNIPTKDVLEDKFCTPKSWVQGTRSGFKVSLYFCLYL